MEKTTLIVSLSFRLKHAAEEYAQSADISLSELVRTVLAEHIGYDLPAEKNSKVERRGRPKKYASEEERQQAVREQQQKRNDLRRMLIEVHQRQQRQDDAQAIAHSIERRSRSLRSL